MKCEIEKCSFELTDGHLLWSHQGNMGEGASADKLLFGVSGIATRSVETLGHTNVELSNVEMPK